MAGQTRHDRKFQTASTLLLKGKNRCEKALATKKVNTSYIFENCATIMNEIQCSRQAGTGISNYICKVKFNLFNV
jgi:hypothetical protein